MTLLTLNNYVRATMGVAHVALVFTSSKKTIRKRPTFTSKNTLNLHPRPKTMAKFKK